MLTLLSLQLWCALDYKAVADLATSSATVLSALSLALVLYSPGLPQFGSLRHYCMLVLVLACEGHMIRVFLRFIVHDFSFKYNDAIRACDLGRVTKILKDWQRRSRRVQTQKKRQRRLCPSFGLICLQQRLKVQTRLFIIIIIIIIIIMNGNAQGH